MLAWAQIFAPSSLLHARVVPLGANVALAIRRGSRRWCRSHCLVVVALPWVSDAPFLKKWLRDGPVPAALFVGCVWHLFVVGSVRRYALP